MNSDSEVNYLSGFTNLEQGADELNRLAESNLQKNLLAAEKAATGAKKIAENANYIKGIAEALRNLGTVSYMKDRTEEAIHRYKEALGLFRNINDESGMAKSFNDLGGIYFKLSDYTKAAKSFLKSLEIKEHLKDSKGIATTLTNLGSVYQKQNNLTAAMAIYRRALGISKKLKLASLQAVVHNNTGEIYIARRKFDTALKHLFISAEIRKRLAQPLALAYIYINIGSVYHIRRDFKNAVKTFNQCAEICKKEGLDYELDSVRLNLAEVNTARGNYEEARKILYPLLKKYEKSRNKSLLHRIYDTLSSLHFHLKEYKTALSYYKRFHRMEMQMLGHENLKQINEMGIKYEVEGKEKEKEIFRLKNVELKDALSKLNVEKKRSDDLLKNILPVDVAEDLKNKGKSPVQYYDSVSVMFIDIKDFTLFSEKLSPGDLVKELDFCFMKFDEIIDKYKLEKIKTIGDAYLCAGGLPKKNKDHATNIVKAAIEIISFIERRKKEKDRLAELGYEVRIGIHSGPVIAGIIGTKKFAYDIWGDTVNTANRMEQCSEPGKINISENIYQLVKRKFKCSYRGKLHAKNKGEIDMYFVNS